MQRALLLFAVSLLAACSNVPLAPPSLTWEQRTAELNRADQWQIDGRTAVAIGTEGWQASLTWRQLGRYADVDLSGPFGIGAVSLQQAADGLRNNGAPPSEAMLAQLQERLGFDLPLGHLRFWLLGIPDPDSAFDLTRNPQDRAAQLTQDGWSIVYDKYLPSEGDVLPARVVLSREDVRVRIIIDRWTLKR